MGGPQAVRGALAHARARTLALADAYARALAPTGLQVRYDPALNPPLWELGHIGWFQEWWIGRNRQRGQGARCDPDAARAPSLLAGADGWYDSARVVHTSRWTLPLPDAAATHAYLADTQTQTLALLDRLPADAGADDLYFFRLVALHEAMHAEAAVYMARSLGIAVPPAEPPLADQPAAPASGAALQVAAQTHALGSDTTGFAFDNELAAHPVRLPAFEIDAQPVTWARYLPFVQAGGYHHTRWWSEAGAAWLAQAPRQPPAAAALDAHAPAVHLTAFEAEAWCNWAGRRLPTEAEWECAALVVPGFAWGRVWEWTASPFEPYPGFVPHPYRDYSQPWFGSRRVLRGACDATSPWLAHPRYRNFFEPQRSDIFCGFRSCARAMAPVGL